MPRRKKKFDKKNAHRFQVVHRSQSDPVFHEEDGSRYVLLPVNAKARKDPEAVFDASAIHKLPAVPEGGSAAGAGAGAGTASAGPSWDIAPPEGTTKLRSKHDEVDEYGFPLDGYNYQQHLRPMGGGGVFVSSTGDVLPSDKVKPKAPVLPPEALPSEEVGERMLESIVINPSRLPPDMREALENAEEGEFEELTDDFVIVAGAEPEGDDAFGTEAFDLDKHLAKLMAAAEREEAGGDETASTATAGEEEVKAGDDSDEELPFTEDKPRNARLLDDHLDVLMAQYADENIGELDPDDPRVAGAFKMGKVLDAAMDEFVESNKATPMFQIEHARADIHAAAAAAGDSALEPVVPFGFAPEDIPDGGDEEIPYPTPPKRPEYDVDTIVSTFTNTENHPTLLDDDDLPSRKPVPRIKISAKTGLPVVEEKAGESGDEEGDEDEEDDEKCVPAPVRSRKETAEERRARKQLVKEQRRAKRAAKKATKTAFKEEEARQLRQRKGASTATTFKM